MRNGERLGDRAFETDVKALAAGVRRRSEGVTLACAVSVALALGGAFGMWVTARLTPTPSAGATAARLLPDARASVPPTPPAHAAGTLTDSGAPKAGASATPDAAAAEQSRAEEVATRVAEPHGATDSGAVAAASPDPSRPAAWEVGPLPKAGGRAAARVNTERGASRVRGGAAESVAQAQSGPCVSYASANSLRIRLGEAAPLILGGPGAGVRINVSTPDWSQLAVIYEGPAGRNGWVRYSVRSVGRRPGLYTVHFSTPCGSQTIPVTVRE